MPAMQRSIRVEKGVLQHKSQKGAIIMRIWVRLFKDTHLVKDTVIEDYRDVSRTKKVMSSLEAACREFDLAVPTWLDLNIRDFQHHSRTRFGPDCFHEEIPFDYMDFRVIEE